MSDANFIPVDRRRRMRTYRRLVIWGGICGAWILMLAVAVSLAHAMYGVDDQFIDDELSAAARRQDKDQQRINALTRTIAAATADLEARKATGDQPDWSVLLALLAEQLGDNVVLSQCDLSAHGVTGERPPQGGPHVTLNRRQFRLTVTGYGRMQADVSRFVLSLEKVKLFRKIKLLGSNRERFYNTEAVAFRVECDL